MKKPNVSYQFGDGGVWRWIENNCSEVVLLLIGYRYPYPFSSALTFRLGKPLEKVSVCTVQQLLGDLCTSLDVKLNHPWIPKSLLGPWQAATQAS